MADMPLARLHARCAARARPPSRPPPQMALLPAVLNLTWVSIYYLVIFVLLNKRIQRRGYQNM